MTQEKYFKTLVILSLLVFIVSFVVTLLTVIYGPSTEEIDQQINEIVYNLFFLPDLLQGAIFIILIVLYVVSLYLLYSFNRYGKQLFTIFFVLDLLLMPFFPVFLMPWEEFIWTIDGVLDVVILVCIYVSPIRERFQG